MDKLLEKLNDYRRLIGCKLVYTLQNRQETEGYFNVFLRNRIAQILGIK